MRNSMNQDGLIKKMNECEKKTVFLKKNKT